MRLRDWLYVLFMWCVTVVFLSAALSAATLLARSVAVVMALGAGGLSIIHWRYRSSK